MGNGNLERFLGWVDGGGDGHGGGGGGGREIEQASIPLGFLLMVGGDGSFGIDFWKKKKLICFNQVSVQLL